MIDSLNRCALLAFTAAVGLGGKCFSAPNELLLLTPLFSVDTVVVDSAERVLHSWSSKFRAASSARLLPDGSILRLGHSLPAPAFQNQPLRGGQVEIISLDGQVRWSHWAANDEFMAVGDAVPLPNGNVLVSVMEHHSKSECTAAGRDETRVSDRGMFTPGLIEFKPIGENSAQIVWRWSVWDHIAQGRHPALPNYHFPIIPYGLVDINVGGSVRSSVWYSIRQLSYDPESDLVVAVIAPFGDVWIIDHSTTTAEAKTMEGGKWKNGGAFASLQRGSDNVTGPKLRLQSADIGLGDAKGPGRITAFGYAGGESILKQWSLHLSRSQDDRWLIAVGENGRVHYPPLSDDVKGGLDALQISDDGKFVVAANSISGVYGRLPLGASSETTDAPISWHKNERGTVSLRVLPKSSPDGLCCGNTADAKAGPAQPTSQAIVRKTAPLGRPQFVPTSIAKLIPVNPPTKIDQ